MQEKGSPLCVLTGMSGPLPKEDPIHQVGSEEAHLVSYPLRRVCRDVLQISGISKGSAQ